MCCNASRKSQPTRTRCFEPFARRPARRSGITTPLDRGIRDRRMNALSMMAGEAMNPSPSWFSASTLNVRPASTTTVLPSSLKK